jgi:hypothetical protein
LDEAAAAERAEAPESSAWFVVIANGAEAGASVVAGLEGVRQALLPLVLAGRADGSPESLAGMLAAIEDPALWAPHGVGDGRPFWHLWVQAESGSVSVQRLTAAPPQPAIEAAEARAASLRRVLEQTRLALTALAADLAPYRTPGTSA